MQLFHIHWAKKTALNRFGPKSIEYIYQLVYRWGAAWFTGRKPFKIGHRSLLSLSSQSQFLFIEIEIFCHQGFVCIVPTSCSQCGTAQILWKFLVVSQLYKPQSVSLCSIPRLSFVFPVLLQGFTVACPMGNEQAGAKTLSWGCLFGQWACCVFFGSGLLNVQ